MYERFKCLDVNAMALNTQYVVYTSANGVPPNY